jgi:hypothetical protein
MLAACPADSTAMRRVLCGVLLLVLGLAPAIEARPRVQLSKRQQRKRYVAQPIKIKHRNFAKAKWGKVKARKH